MYAGEIIKILTETTILISTLAKIIDEETEE